MRACLPIPAFAGLLVVIAGMPGAAFAATPSGTAVAVVQATDIVGSTGQRVLQPEAPVFTGDRVITDLAGEAQIRFRDDTRLVVGPGSSLLIDKFVFTDDDTARSVTVNALRGTFRFISGASPKGAYLIRTPTATMGLRGTHFDFAIGPEGETRLALYEGGLRFCDLAGRCIDLSGRCDVVVAPPGQGIRKLEPGVERTALLNASFPYLQSQWSLRSEFRIDTSSCTAAAVTPVSPIFTPAPPEVKPDCPPPKHHGRKGGHKGGQEGGQHAGKGGLHGGKGGKGGSHAGGHFSGGKSGFGRGGQGGWNGGGDGTGHGFGHGRGFAGGGARR